MKKSRGQVITGGGCGRVSLSATRFAFEGVSGYDVRRSWRLSGAPPDIGCRSLYIFISVGDCIVSRERIV